MRCRSTVDRHVASGYVGSHVWRSVRPVWEICGEVAPLVLHSAKAELLLRYYLCRAPRRDVPVPTPDRPPVPNAPPRNPMTETVRRTHYRVTFAVLLLGTIAYALLQSLVLPVLPVS